jgi:hypothetical protein
MSALTLAPRHWYSWDFFDGRSAGRLAVSSQIVCDVAHDRPLEAGRELMAGLLGTGR